MIVGVVRAAILALLFPLSACLEEFEPFVAIDGIYSINGYLDAAADTQWVRVTSFRTSILTTPDPVDAVVTLEHLGSGRVVQMNDTVFTFPSPNVPGGAGYAHNFWTTEPIERGATYRLTASRSDGESATAIVKIPRGLGEVPVTVGVRRRDRVDSVFVDFDVLAGDYLAIFGLSHHLPVPHPCGPSGRPDDVTLFPFHGTRPAGPSSFRSPTLVRTVLLPDAACEGREPPETYVGWEFIVVLSGEPWPYSPGDAIGYLGQGSNVQNGQGYLGGITYERVAIPFCVYSGQPRYCELFFGPESATLDVTIVADGVPVEQPIDVRLRKGDEGWTRTSDHVVVTYGPSPPREKVFWNAPLTIARFPGLEPGAYRIEVAGTFNNYCEERSIVLAPGEHRAIEVVGVNRFQFPNELLNARGCRES